MVSKGVLLKSAGIVGLQKRKQQVKQTQYKIPKSKAVQPQQPSQSDLEAQKRYEYDLKVYQSAMKEQGEWVTAQNLVMRGKGYAAKGDPGVYAKVQKIHKYQSEMGKYAMMKAPTPPGGAFVTTGLTITKNVYDTATKTYTDSAGNKMSMASAPKGAIVTDSRLTTPKISAPTISYETKRYQDLGYTQPQASKLAKESVRQGGMTFSPERAKEITKLTTREKLRDIYIATSPITLGAKRTVEAVSKSKKIVKQIKETEKITSKMDRLSRELKGLEQVYINENGEWTSSEKAKESYLRKVKEYEKSLKDYERMGAVVEEGKITEPKVTLGFFGLTKEEPISKYKGLTSPWSALSTQVDIMGGEYFATIGAGIEKIGIKSPEREIKYKYTTLAPYPSGTIQSDVLTGEPNLFITKEGSYIRPEVTSKEIGEKVYKFGSGAVSLGKYAVPVVGMGFFAGETAGRVQESGGIKPYIKAHPGEALLTGGIILTAGTLGGARYLTKVTGKEIVGGVRYSTRAQDLFGKRIRISREGVETLPSKSYKYQITKKILVPGESRELLSIVGKPGLQEKVAGKTITYFEELTGTARDIKVGQKIIVETPEGILYGGKPYGKLGQLERKKVTEYLEKQGYTKKQINQMIRFKQPKVIESSFLGKGKIIQAEDKLTYELAGTLKSQPIKRITEEIPSRLGQGEIKYIKISGKPVAGGKEGIQLFRGIEDVRKAYLTKKGLPFSKLSQAGKTRETFDILSSTKKITPKELPPVKLKLVKERKGVYALETEGAQLEFIGGKEYGIYRDVSISKKVIPSVRKPDLTKSIVLVEKGEPTLKVIDETVIKTTGFKGGGKPSSEQFFKQLYSIEEQKQVMGGAVSSAIKKELPTIKQPSVKTISILETKETPLMVGGTGLKTLPYAGTQQYEYQELGAMTISIPTQKAFVETRPSEKLEVISIQKPSLKFKTPQLNVPKEIIKPREEFKMKEVLKPIERVREKEKLKISEVLKVAQRLKQEQILQLKQLSILKQPQKVKQPITPKITPKIKIPIKLPSLLKRLEKKAEEGELFEIFVTKKGKEVKLEDTFTTLGLAKKKLLGELGTTLRAGGFITRGGKPIKFGELGMLGGEFRPSKVSPFKVIQKKEKRLKKGGREAREIQFFR